MKTIKRMWLRKIVARYIKWLEYFGYFLVLLVGAIVITAWMWEIPTTSKSAEAVELRPYVDYGVTKEIPENCVVLEVKVEDKQEVTKGDELAVITYDPEVYEKSRLIVYIQQLLENIKKVEEEEIIVEGEEAAENSSDDKTEKVAEDKKDIKPEVKEDVKVAEKDGEKSCEPTDPSKESEEKPKRGLNELEKALKEKYLADIENWKKEIEEFSKNKKIEKVVIKANCKGMVKLGDCKIGKTFKKEENVIGVMDFTKLRANMSFKGKNQYLVRPGLQVMLEITAGLKEEEISIRLNTDSSTYIPYHGSRQDKFHNVKNKEIRDICGKALDGTEIQDIEKMNDNKDIVLNVSKVKDISINLQGELHKEIQAVKFMFPDIFRKELMKGVVIEGKHKATYKIFGVKEDVEKSILNELKNGFKDWRIEDPKDNYMKYNGFTGKYEEYRPFEKYQVNPQFKDFVININVDAEYDNKSKWDLEKYPNGLPYDDKRNKPLKNPFSPGADTTNVTQLSRKFEGIIQIVDPPTEFVRIVKEMAKEDKYFKAKAEVIVGKRRFAMILFRKN